MKTIINLTVKSILLFFLLLLISPVSFANASSLNDLIRQQEELDRQIQDNQRKADEKAKQANTLEGQISSLESDISLTEKRITNTAGQIDEVQGQIVDIKGDISTTEQELQKQTANFNQSVVELYRAGRQSNLEKLFSSQDLSDALEKTTYLDSVQNNLNELVQKITTTKDGLEQQKKSMDEKNSNLMSLQEQNKAAKYSAEAQQSQKTTLLGATESDKATYEKLITKLQQEHSNISAQIYAERQRGQGGESFGGGGSGYPYGAIDVPDAWGFLTRECTSYAAWAWNARFGKEWHNTQPGRGSARYWPEIARTLGYSVSGTPHVGAIISWSSTYAGDQWGHVAIVEGINGDGTINISEYNWLEYSYSYRSNVNPGNYGSYSYIY